MSKGIVSGNVEQMTAARRALGAARTDLSAFGAQASGVRVPSQPAGIAGRVKAALADTSRAAAQAERQLTSMQADLARRQLLFMLADAAGSFTPLRAPRPKAGSGDLAGDGFIADNPSSALNGIEEALERYSKRFDISVSYIARTERRLVSSTRHLIRNGRLITVTVVREVSVPIREVNISRIPVRGAQAAARAAGALGKLGHLNDVYSLGNAFTTKGKDRPAAIAGAVGGIAGGRLGGSGGAALGAGIGMAVGGPPGALIGAGVGALAGSWVGSELGKRTGEIIGEGARRGVNAAKSAAKKAGDAVGHAADKAGDAFGSAKKALGGLF